jgi:hypothetical protein
VYVSSVIGVINNISLTISLTSRDKIQFQRARDRIANKEEILYKEVMQLWEDYFEGREYIPSFRYPSAHIANYGFNSQDDFFRLVGAKFVPSTNLAEVHLFHCVRKTAN